MLLPITPIVRSMLGRRDSGQRLRDRLSKAKQEKEEASSSPIGSHTMDQVKTMLLEHGEGNFHREILHFGKSKGELSYLEAKEQFDRRVLLDDEYYNGIINCRIHRSHVQGLKDDRT